MFMKQICKQWNNESNSSLIGQKDESQNGCFKKTKHAKFSEKTNITYPPLRTEETWRGVFTYLQNSITDSWKSSVIRQKGETQNGGNKKTNHAKFSEKKAQFGVLFSWNTSFQNRLFALLPTN